MQRLVSLHVGLYIRKSLRAVSLDLTCTQNTLVIVVCMQGNARLVEGLIRKLGLNKPTLVGHSQGALVAMEVYRR